MVGSGRRLDRTDHPPPHSRMDCAGRLSKGPVLAGLPSPVSGRRYPGALSATGQTNRSAIGSGEPAGSVARRDVVQYDNVAGNFLIAERRFAGDGRFDQPHAGLDVLDQGREVRYDRAIAVISTVGLDRSAATGCVGHECSPSLRFYRVRCYLWVKSWSRTNT